MQHEDLETYRAMRPGERLALGLELTALAWDWLDVPDRQAGDRKLAAWEREQDLSNAALLAALAAADRRMREASPGN
jgi:hypothetical protein